MMGAFTISSQNHETIFRTIAIQLLDKNLQQPMTYGIIIGFC